LGLGQMLCGRGVYYVQVDVVCAKRIGGQGVVAVVVVVVRGENAEEWDGRSLGDLLIRDR